jgi:hypothetical protein
MVLNGSPQTNIGAYKVFWFSIICDKCFGVAMLTSYDMATHYGVDELLGSFGEATVKFFNDNVSIGSFHATKKYIIIIIKLFSIPQRFMGRTLHLKHTENPLYAVRWCKFSLKFLNNRFLYIVFPHSICALILCTLRAGSYIVEPNLEDLDFLNYSLDYFQALLFGNNNVCEILKELLYLYLHEKLLACVSFAIGFAKCFIASLSSLDNGYVVILTFIVKPLQACTTVRSEQTSPLLDY